MVLMAQPGIGAEVEGVHAVTAALAAGRVTRLSVESSRRSALADLVADARQRGVSVEFVDDVRDLASTSAPQGVVARCRPIQPVSLETAVARRTPTTLVVLDHLEDPRNVGAVARSAVAAGFTGMVMSTHRSAPLSATSFKSAAGAFEHLDLVVVSSVADAIEQLRKLQVWSVGLDMGGDQQLFGMKLLTEPLAIVIGAEGSGLSRLVAQRCDVIAGIPIDPRVESLNASVAAALALFDVARVRAG
jgi:23S rRNA (guanosine2251-2'-O)-methyltransferase